MATCLTTGAHSATNGLAPSNPEDLSGDTEDDAQPLSFWIQLRCDHRLRHSDGTSMKGHAFAGALLHAQLPPQLTGERWLGHQHSLDPRQFRRSRFRSCASASHRVGLTRMNVSVKEAENVPRGTRNVYAAKRPDVRQWWRPWSGHTYSG